MLRNIPSSFRNSQKPSSTRNVSHLSVCYVLVSSYWLNLRWKYVDNLLNSYCDDSECSVHLPTPTPQCWSIVETCAVFRWGEWGWEGQLVNTTHPQLDSQLVSHHHLFSKTTSL